MVRMSIVTLKPFGMPGLGQQRLGLVHVELVGLVGAGTEQADRQEVLVHDADVLDHRGADGVVVDQPLEGLAHLGLGQDRVLLVQAEVVDRALGRAGGLDVLVGRQRVQVLRRQVARDVGVALFQQQALRGGFP
jgi:hypothetical protein